MTDVAETAKGLPKSDWIWMPHPGHFICARDCRFHLSTYVGGYLVSTVGEYEPDSQVKEIIAEARGIKLKGRGDERRRDWFVKCGWEEIGCNRTYETMVFTAKPREGEGKGCCPFVPADFSSVDFAGYNSADEAARGHMELCEKWSMSDVSLKAKQGDE